MFGRIEVLLVWGVWEGHPRIHASQAPQPEEKLLFPWPGRVAMKRIPHPSSKSLIVSLNTLGLSHEGQERSRVMPGGQAMCRVGSTGP